MADKIKSDSGSGEIMMKMICRVTLLDHHKTAFEEMESRVKTPDNLEINLDMHLSGATIALQYFKPEVARINR